MGEGRFCCLATGASLTAPEAPSEAGAELDGSWGAHLGGGCPNPCLHWGLISPSRLPPGKAHTLAGCWGDLFDSAWASCAGPSRSGRGRTTEQPETLADAHRPCSKRQALSMAAGSHNRLWAAVNTRLQQAQELELDSPYCQEIATDQGLRERHRHMHTEIEIQRQRGRQRHRERHRRQRRETGNTETEID